MNEEIIYLDNILNIIDKEVKYNLDKINNTKKDIIDSKRFIYERNIEFNKVESNSAMDDANLDVTVLNDLIKKNYKLELAKDKPYFGRVDFNGDKIYIGLTNISDKDINKVYDWRAPISNLYYNYNLGNAKYIVDNKTYEGDITLKRIYDIKMGKLINYFDSNSSSNDIYLSDVISNNNTDYMKNIVSTISKKQNDIIRYNHNTNLIIEGVAGSGKTSIVMHKIAYLLYNTKYIDNNNVLILSPTNAFTSFISNVLPSLGEENVPTKTLLEMLNRILKTSVIPAYRDNDNMNNLYMKDILDKYIEEYTSNMVFTKSFNLKKVKITSTELNTMYNKVKHMNFLNRINYISSKLCDRFNIDEDKYINKLNSILIDSLGIEDSLKEYTKFTNSTIYLDNFDKWDNTISITDAINILYLKNRLISSIHIPNIKYLVIDEAQDYSLMVYTVLKDIYKSAIFTICGDKNQVIMPFKYNSLEEINKVIDNTTYMYLNTSYRSSKAIIEYSNNILGLKNIISIRDNKKSIKYVNSLDEGIKYLKTLSYNNVSIITPSFELENKLKEIYPDIKVINVYSAKGLEFDAVLLHGFTNSQKNLHYIASTRSIEELIVIK